MKSIDIIKMNYIFVRKNIEEYIEKNKLKFSLENKTNKVGAVLAIIIRDKKEEEFHRVVFSLNAWKFKENIWIEEQKNMTVLPMIAENKKDVMLMKFILGRSLDIIKKHCC